MHSSGIPIDLLTRETIRTSNNPVTANKPYHGMRGGAFTKNSYLSTHECDPVGMITQVFIEDSHTTKHQNITQCAEKSHEERRKLRSIVSISVPIK